MALPLCKKCANYIPTTGRCRQTNTKTSPWNDGCGEYTLHHDLRLENLKS